MTSLHTNAGAMSALQTLRSIGASLTTAQRAISSGLDVQTAADNAAYWSISTTMRSDHKALSTVTDALGLGAAAAEVAYTATDSIVDVLTTFKARLVAAKEDGIDKSKIQAELSELVKQTRSVVGAASFGGVNWLETSAPSHLMNTPDLHTSVVSGFVRSAGGSVAAKTTELNLKMTSMLNDGGGGILQKELGGIGDIGGFRGTNANSIAHQGHEARTFTGPASFGATDYVEFDLLVDAGALSAGQTFAGLRIDKALVDAALGTSDGTISTGAEMRTVLEKLFVDNSIPATAYETMFSSTDPSKFEIGSLETSGEPGSSIEVMNVNSSFGGAYPPGYALGLENPPYRDHDNMYPSADITFSKPFTVSPTSSFWFDVQVGTGALTTHTVDRSVVDAALGTTDGYIADATALATVLAYVAAPSNLAVTANGTEITFSADLSVYPEAGNRAARVNVGNVQSNPSWALEFDLDEVDITGDDFTLDEYIRGVEFMLKGSIASASLLGSLQSRIDLQSEFTTTLMSSIDRGIGRLVDADMNEQSTRLKALQTQQQLAMQSLQIANSNAESILALFR
ncbi:flagellin [Hoeflea olei]|uniref:Flagellin n=1 Tax=Hoeflea olei TaxID=1480615 RepID=A0A1C1YZ39_9HYPH|nr:flagellin [Hoeflea olei]OCW58737.1 flagellin [Hoeflea olei]